MIKENLPIYIKRFLLGFIIVLTAIFQNMPHNFSANAMLLIPVIVSISMFESEIVSLVFGLIGGLLWDFVGVSGNFYHTLILCVSAFFISMLIRMRVRNTLLSSMILTLILSLIHNTVYWIAYVLIPSPIGAGRAFFGFYFLSCIYTVLAGIVIYLIVKPIEKSFRV